MLKDTRVITSVTLSPSSRATAVITTLLDPLGEFAIVRILRQVAMRYGYTIHKTE